MGDISEMRGLVVCVTFIATAITLILAIPSGFFPASTPTQRINPTSGNFRNIFGYNESYLWNFTGNYLTGVYPAWNPARPVHEQRVIIGGYNIIITESWFTTFNDTGGNETDYHWELQAEVCDVFWSGVVDYHYNREDFRWINQNGTETTSNHDVLGSFGSIETHKVLTLAQLDIDSRSTNPYGNNTWSPETAYTITNSRTTFNVVFEYNITLHPYPTHAYEGIGSGNVCGLTMAIGQDFSERATQMNAWTLITGFLFFQLIPDLPVVLSLLIEAPIWIAEAYLLFIFALRVIGAVFGGGGA
jgi:hypothetical protein